MFASSRRLFSFVWVVVSVATQLVGQSPAGTWVGTIETPGTPLAVSVELRQRGDAWSGTIDIPQQGAKALPLAKIAVAAPAVRFSIAAVPGDPTFDGTMDETGSILKGTFRQGGQELSFLLSRGQDGAVAVKGKLDGFQAWLDEALPMFEVPGCAVAVVQRGELVATFQSGRRDRERDLPVTKDTLFAIGSSTKAFTTCVLGMLADAGKLDWDAPVRSVIPDFALADAPLGERITVRDLVTHRSGMPRHDLVWYGAKFERAELVRRLRHLPLNHDLRTDFQYNNLMYLTAGHVAERVLGTTWEAAVRARILEPLGMARTNFDVGATQRDADHAEPYAKDQTTAKVEKIAFRDLGSVGPAGSINSSVAEMARWVALHLRDGDVDGRRLLAAATARELRTVCMPIGDSPLAGADLVSVGYGLGWFVDVYRGHRRVHHGGNIDGFSALVTLLPDAGFGFVVLTNFDGTPLPELVARTLTDRVLGLEARDWRAEAHQRRVAADAQGKQAEAAAAGERRLGTSPTFPLADYIGDYAHPGYGACRVELRDGALHLDLHGLGARLEHWHYDVFHSVRDTQGLGAANTAVQFCSDFDGEIELLRAVLEPSVAPIEFGRQPDARLRDPLFLAVLAGDYEVGGQVATFTLVQDQLVLTLPGQRHVLEAGRGLRFRMAGLTGYSVRFVLDADGKATEAMFRQPEGLFEGKRKR